MRGRLKPNTTAMRTEVGGSLLSVSIKSASDSYSSHKDDYYVNLFDFMPSAPGPYYTGYTDRSVPGIPYDDNDLEDHNLQKDLDIYNLVVSEYNLGGAHHQKVVQAIADKECDAHHLFGPNRESGGYSFHPVFGQDTIGRYIDAEGDTGKVIGYILDMGIASRQALKQGAWDGRCRPGQKAGTATSKDAPYGVLYNYTIDNIDGHPVSGYNEAGYNTSQTGAVHPNSYPSGHSSGIWATALYLVELMPSRAASIMKAANQFAVNRQICRYHWNSDTIIGRLCGATIAPVMRAASDYEEMFADSYAEFNGGTAEWKATIEATGIKMGQYLWTRRKDYYSDNRMPTVEYTVARWGIDGDGISEINSYYLATSNNDLKITAATDTYPMPGDSGWNNAKPQQKWFDAFADCATANSGVGQMQGWMVWEKTVIKYDAYDKDTGEPVTRPDVIQYKSSRIGKDGQIGMEEYYMLSEYNDFEHAFGGTTYAKVGIRWYNPSNPAADKWRLSDTTPNINPSMWSTTMPTYNKDTHGKKIYLWNFEQSVDGDGTEYATKPVCIGNHARGIKGVIELYALSASQTPKSTSILIPDDLYQKNGYGTIPTSGFNDKQVWSDEKYERAPSEALPYQWNWTRTLYSAQDENGKDYEDHYHVSSVRGTAGEDGSGTEFIYCRPKSHNADGSALTVTLPDPNIKKDAGGTDRSDDYIKKTDDFIPFEYTDNPVGIDFQHQVEYQCERKSKSVVGTGGFSAGHEWGAFSSPVPWSKWGKNGQDGDGVEYVFIRTKKDVAPILSSAAAKDSGNRSATDAEYLPVISNATTCGAETNGKAGECTDDPKGATAEYPYEWVAKRTMASPNAESGKRVWKTYYDSVGSPYKMSRWNTHVTLRLDISNEMDSVQTDSTGKISAARTVETVVHLYDGSAEIDISAAELTISGAPAATIATTSQASEGTGKKGRKVSLAFKKDQTMANSYEVTISYTHNDVPYSAIFSITASKGEAIWQLKPAMSAIPFKRKADNSLTPESQAVSLKLVKIDGGSTTEYNAVQTGLTVRYSTASMPSSSTAGTNWSSGTISVANDKDNLFIALFNSAGTLLDRETVPVVRDGEKGDGAKRLDISNEMDSVQTDSTGKISAARTVETVVHLYDGSAEIDISAAELTISGAPAATIATTSQASEGTGKKGRKVSLAFKKDQTMANSYEVTISYTHNDVPYSAIFSITASKGEAIWQLKPDHAALSFGRNSDDSFDPTSIYLKLSILKIDGGTYEEITPTVFYTNYGYVRYSYDSMPSSRSSGTEWKDGVTSSGLQVQGNNSKEQVFIALFDNSGNLLDRETVPIVRQGLRGQKGDSVTGSPGHVGRWYYYAGEYSSTQNYKFESTRAPYVSIGSNYYLLDYAYAPDIQNSSTTRTIRGISPTSTSDTNPWSPMTAGFKYIITEAMFTDYAKMGSFFINGDWMISKYGVIYYSDGSTNEIFSESKYNSFVSNEGVEPYTCFDPNYPVSSKPSAMNFCPIYAVDGKTGKIVANQIYTIPHIVEGDLTISNPHGFYILSGGGENTVTIPSAYGFLGLEIKFLNPAPMTRIVKDYELSSDSYFVYEDPSDAGLSKRSTTYEPPFNKLITIVSDGRFWYVSV